MASIAKGFAARSDGLDAYSGYQLFAATTAVLTITTVFPGLRLYARN